VLGPLQRAVVLVLALGLAALLGSAPGAAGAHTNRTGTNEQYLGAPGYLIVTARGAVATFGGAGFAGDLAATPAAPVLGVATTADRRGYWLLSADGAVHAFGDATHRAAARSMPGAVAIAGDPVTGGYWTVDAPGDLRAVGAPVFARPVLAPGGSPVVGVASAAGGLGVWMVERSGAVIATGTVPTVAAPQVSAAAGPVVAITATPDGAGYWLATATGAVLCAGDATTYGSLHDPRSPVIAFATTPDGRGYLLVSADGSAGAFGDARFAGDAASPLHPPLYPGALQVPPTEAVGAVFQARGPQPARRGPLRVTFVGDSLSVQVARDTQRDAAVHHLDVRIDVGGILGCGMVGSLALATYSNPRPTAPTLPACGQWLQQYRQAIATSHPNVVVLLSGYWESQHHSYDGSTVAVATSAPFRSYLARQLGSALRLARSAGARVVLLDAPYFGDGTPRANVDAWDTLVDSAGSNGVTRLDLRRLLDPDGRAAPVVDGVRVRAGDRVHLTEAGVHKVIDPWLVPQLLAAARTDRHAIGVPTP
jgi:hypothetical protein